MVYEIVKDMPPVTNQPPATAKTPERIAMEKLEVGDGFWIEDEQRMVAARSLRRALLPKKFSIRKDQEGRRGWQVRRTW